MNFVATYFCKYCLLSLKCLFIYLRCPDSTFEQLKGTSSHTIEHYGIKATKLCTHKDDVDEVNSLELKNLHGEAKVFRSVDSDTSYSDHMDKFLPVKQSIQLKVGAQVI